MRVSFSYRNYENSRIASVISALNSMTFRGFFFVIDLIAVGIALWMTFTLTAGLVYEGEPPFMTLLMAEGTFFVSTALSVLSLAGLLLVSHLLEAVCIALNGCRFFVAIVGELKLWLRTCLRILLGGALLTVLTEGIGILVGGINLWDYTDTAVYYILGSMPLIVLPIVIFCVWIAKKKEKKQDESVYLSTDGD